MLFMALFSYEPDKRDEVFKRVSEKGMMKPEGVKLIGHWDALQVGRGFGVWEAEDPKDVWAFHHAWSDLLKIEIVPIMETEEVLKLV